MPSGRTPVLVAAALAVGLLSGGPAAAWEPTAPVELVVPAGTGGGADQMARFLQATIARHGLLKQPMLVVNKAGNSGAEGLLDLKASHGNPNKLAITLSNLFTTPLATGLAFNWRDVKPVTMLALDQFVLWVRADSAHKTAQEFIGALRTQPAGSIKLGGTGSKQEDQLVGVLLEAAVGGRLSYVPLKGGGDVVAALVAGQVDATVNNPIEAEAQWRAGKVRPLCVFDGARLANPGKVAGGQGWSDIPTCMSVGIPVQYLMLRGIFAPPDATPEQVAFYVQLFTRVSALPEWKDFMAKGAFKDSQMAGAEFTAWLDKAESFHKLLMREAKLIAK
ncbi:tripartite tricarboxylate transporter substrate binding protein [Ideonella sp. A 288]|uniref:Bug family tripartite tricarboxylate transporter substrate binding protein n=1 Tax=Ideonella sp. A 288 TaxID=1962181 RepID=UPI000B4B78F7|nr:tripartite tricarboxylate transporter substrate-binding protein [Ideonella sp. A 288]